MTYFNVKYDKLNLREKKFVFLEVKRNLKGNKLLNSENKKIASSKYVTFDETSLLKSTVSQQVERMKTKNISQQVNVDATPPSPIGSVPVGISPDVTPSGYHATGLDAEQVREDVELFTAIGTKMNQRK